MKTKTWCARGGDIMHYGSKIKSSGPSSFTKVEASQLQLILHLFTLFIKTQSNFHLV